MTGSGASFDGVPRLGSMLGRYRLESVLGRGGMGVVFLATDAELERPVALKVLAPELADDEAFRRRFVRESRTLAAVEHPGIVPVYEAGEIAGVLFIAMRFVPGEDLGRLLHREAPLPLGRALAIGEQVASALDAAHRRGLVHRDVKPANILLEPGPPERASLVDFGLTRRQGETAGWSAAGPLGTVDYMAPEQVRGEPVDGRSDQYSLACVLYHCLAGVPPFGGESDAAVLYAHVNTPPPPLDDRLPGVGRALAQALARGMAKDPAARYPDSASLVAALRASAGPAPAQRAQPGQPQASPVGSRVAPATGSHPDRQAGRPRPLALVAAAGAIGLALVGTYVLGPFGGQEGPATSPSSVPADTAVLPLPTPPATPTPAATAQDLGVIVFSSDRDGRYDLFRIDPDGSSLRALTRTRGRDEGGPAISPDGSRIAFTVGPVGARDVYIMDADGTHEQRLTRHAADDYWPEWSPDGRQLAFTSDRTGELDVFLVTDAGRGFSEARAANLTDRPALEEHPTWSPSGRRLAIGSNYWGGGRDIVVIDPGRPGDERAMTRLTATGHYDLRPTWSPDGRLIAFDRASPDKGPADLFVMNARGGALAQLTDTPANEFQADFSPDGSALVFRKGPQSAPTELFTVPVGGGAPTRLTDGMADAAAPDWGARLVVRDRDGTPTTGPTTGPATDSPGG